MSINLLDAAKGLFSHEMVEKASSYLGESHSGVMKALSGILPSIFGGLVQKTGSGDGAQTVTQMAQEQHQSGALDKLGGFFGNDIAKLTSNGGGLLSGIFGHKLDGITGLISNFSGIKSSSASTLMSMAAPVVLGLIGKHTASNNSGNAAGITSLLNSHKDIIAAAMPSGLNISGDAGGNMASIVPDSVAPAAISAKQATEKTAGALKILVPVALLILAAMAAWYFLGKGCNNKADTVLTDADSVKTEQPASDIKAAMTSAGKVDSLTGNYIYELGKQVTIELPNGAGKLEVGENSTENKLFQFLSNPGSKIDTVKGNWFEFTNVHFKTGGAEIDDASMVQLKNMVAITKGYASAKFKLGGYTDNTGNAAGNVALSQKRADAVIAMLKKLGAGDNSFAGAKGYGPEFPLGDNNTAEGRSMNRRVAVNVKAK